MNASRTNNLVIRTPEGIEFSYLLASPAIRFLAWGVDLACITVISNIVLTVLGVLGLINIDFYLASTFLLLYHNTDSLVVVTMTG